MFVGFHLFAASWQWQPGHLHDPDPPFELEDKPFAGQRLAAIPGKVEPTYYRALTGNAATATAGTLVGEKLISEDNFTDTNNTTLGSHTSDTGQTWTKVTSLGGVGDPWIQGNRLRLQNGEYNSVWFLGVEQPAVQAVEAEFKGINSYSGGYTEHAEAVGVRLSDFVDDGYYWGWTFLGEWSLIKRVGGVGTVMWQALIGSAVGAGETHKVRLEVYGTSTTVLKCYLDGVLVHTENDSSAPIDYVGYGGVWLGSQQYAASTWSFEFNWFRHLDASTGAFVTLTGLAATTAQGTIYPAGPPPLTGQVATAIAGALGAGFPPVGLTGLAATTAQGTLASGTGVGGSGTMGTPVPKLVATRYADNVTTNWMPGYAQNTFLSAGGILYGAGTDFDYSFNRFSRRMGLFKVSQIARDTNPWTQKGNTWTSTDANSLSTNMTSIVGSLPFPRANSLQYELISPFAAIPPLYNTVSNRGGTISVDPDGNIAVAHFMSLIGKNVVYPSSAETYRMHDNGVEYYLAPQFNDPNSQNYWGPELYLGRYENSNRTLYHRSALGIYSVKQNEILAFYPAIIDADISGTSVRLVGCRVTTDSGVIGYTNSDPNKIVELVGRAATGNIGRFRANNEGFGDLSGNVATTAQGALVGDNTGVNIVPAFKRITTTNPLSSSNTTSGPTFLTSFSGASRVWALEDALCVTHSGYGDTIYVTYLSTSPTSGTNTPTHIGIVVMDAVSGVVTSHTLTALSATPAARFWGSSSPEVRPYGKERSVAEVVKLSSGTSVTQFLMRGQIVHLSWTSGTATAPTLTLKTGPSTGANFLIGGWESLEARGDSVYHVLYRADSSLKEDLTGVYANDATGTSSTWVDTTTTYSGNHSGGKLTSLDSGGNLGAMFSGYGGGGPTWLFVSRVEFGPSIRDNHTVWVDYWDQQPAFFSVQAVGRVGRVTVNISYGIVDLTGLRANTAQGVLTPDLSISVALTGLRANTARGSITPTQQLTGLAATTAQGTLTPDLTVYGVLTGLVATTAQGSLQPPVSLALVGIRIYGYGGLLRPATGELVGLRATVIRGDVAPSGSSNAAQTGAAAVTAWGAATPNLAKAVVGYAATMGAGLLASTVGARLVGLPLLTATGVLTTATAVSVALTGRAATATGGTLAPQSALDTTLTGRSAVATAGTLIPLVTVTVTGARGTTSSGVLVPLLSPVVQGRQAVCAAGVLQVLTNIFLTGRQGTLVQGVLGHTHGCTLYPSGVWATGAVGVVSFKLPTDGSFLWAVQESDELAVQAEVQQEFVTISPN